MIIVRIVQFVKIVQLVQLDYYGYIKFFGVFVGTWVGAFTFKLDDQIDMKFEAEDDEGNFKPATVKLSFKNNLINKKLCTYMKALEIRENMIND